MSVETTVDRIMELVDRYGALDADDARLVPVRERIKGSILMAVRHPDLAAATSAFFEVDEIINKAAQ